MVAWLQLQQHVWSVLYIAEGDHEQCCVCIYSMLKCELCILWTQVSCWSVVRWIASSMRAPCAIMEAINAVVD